jgi:DNA invertase Pin-like site-specific DNA recombinase
MKQCFGYVRVSSLKQGEGVSLDAQKDAIRRFAGTNEITISRWFEEQQTAAKSGRPVFNQMMKALKAGKADGLVMHKIDRSARNYADWHQIGELADNGIDVYFATESLDFRSRGGRLTANFQMAVAEDYCRNLSMEVKKGQLGQLERGFYPFSAPPGYRNNGKHQLKTIDPLTGPLVKYAFELYGSGQYSMHSLRREMAKRGLSKPTGEPLSKGTFEKMLSNPFYTGVIRIKTTGDVYQGAHEPLISAKLFQRVQDVKAGKSGKKVTRHNHLFRGLFVCGQCGRSMIPERQKGYVYYRCQFPECPKNIVRQERLEEVIADVLGGTKLTDEVIRLVDQRVKARVRVIMGAIDPKTMAMQLSKIDEQIEKLEDAAIEQIIDKSTFDKRKEKLLVQKAEINDKLRDSAEFYRNPAVITKFLERLKNLAEHYYFADPAEKREIVEITLSNRKVTAKNVSAEPSNWLVRTQRAVAVLSCAHARTTSRTFEGKCTWDNAVKELAKLAKSPENEQLQSLFIDGYRKSAVQHIRSCNLGD